LSQAEPRPTPPARPALQGGDDARRAAISRACFEVADVLAIDQFDDYDDIYRRDRAFRVLAEVIADAAGADDAETLLVAQGWLGALEERWEDDEEDLDWDRENVGHLRGIRRCIGALIWVAATRSVGIE